MSDVFATLVRRSRAAGVLAPVLGSAFERPLAEPIWSEREEVRIAPRAPSTRHASPAGERPHGTPAARMQAPGPHDPGAVTRQVLEVRHEPTQPAPSTMREARQETPAAAPSLDPAAIVDAALRQRPRVAKETVVVREAAARAATETSERKPAQAHEDRRPLVVVTAPPVVPAPVVESRPQPAAAPSIEVRIGRIEVMAAPPPAPAPPMTPRAPRPRPVTLNDYLARRGRR